MPARRVLAAERALGALASPARQEILEALATAQCASSAELGERLGRTAGSVHYHLRQLEEVGLVEVAELRPSGRRPEIVWRACTEQITLSPEADEPRARGMAARAAQAFLRQTTRDLDHALREGDDLELEGPGRKVLGLRGVARLTDSELATLNRRLDSILELITRARGQARKKGHLVSLTAVLAPPRGRS